MGLKHWVRLSIGVNDRCIVRLLLWLGLGLNGRVRVMVRCR